MFTDFILDHTLVEAKVLQLQVAESQNSSWRLNRPSVSKLWTENIKSYEWATLKTFKPFSTQNYIKLDSTRVSKLSGTWIVNSMWQLEIGINWDLNCWIVEFKQTNMLISYKIFKDNPV